MDRRYLLLAAAAAATLFAPGAGAARVDPVAAALGKPVPAFSLEDTGGKIHSLAEQRGHWLVLLFGTTWCPVTNGKVKPLSAIARDFASRGVRVLAVDIDEPRPKVEEWMRRKKPGFPVLLDSKGAVSARFAPEDFAPEKEDRSEVMISASAIVDPEGTLRYLQLFEGLSKSDRDLKALRERLTSLVKP